MRIFDNAHGSTEHHEHRFIGFEKQEPIITHGSVNDAMHAAEVKLRGGWFDIVRSLGQRTMNTVYDKTWDLFMAASMSDDDLGYPDEVEHRTLIDRLRGHVPVNVAHRTQGHAAPFATASRLGRHPVRQMRELAHA